MRAFIVRPFGIKEGVDFDKVEKELIQPALENVGIVGSTTAPILEAGNIREDMFHLLITADLVIADLSIHNANVFYELGIRHALRDKKTFLIRCAVHDIPFDLKTDRYISYDSLNPKLKIEELSKGLFDTINSNRKDSPVFLMLPKLTAQNPELFITVPNDFGEEVEIARGSQQIGKLALLAEEAEDFKWKIPALRRIGEVLFNLKAFDDAKETWEKIRKLYPEDIESNDRLATVYQRLAELEIKHNPVLAKELFIQSDLSIERLLNNLSLFDKSKRAEVFCLQARNAKSRWLNSWINADKQEDKKIRALGSGFLSASYEEYRSGFMEDLNHFYSGINALGLLKIMLTLAEDHPDTWETFFDSSRDSKYKLDKYKEDFEKLSSILSISIEAEKFRLTREGKKDPWLNFTEADLACLVSNNPKRAASLYKIAIESATGLNFESAKRQLRIYHELGIQRDNVGMALSVFGDSEEEEELPCHSYILFTGHMIDNNRKEPRFPAEKENEVKKAIKEILNQEKEKLKGNIIGIGGGACGGDIIFHEVCEELNIPTALYLALPRDQFIVESVQFAGNQWVDRFDELYKKLPVQILSQSKELPIWLRKKNNYSIWERNNLWMLFSSLVHGGHNSIVIALWDGKGGDASGGTEHMVQEAKRRGARVIVIDPNSL